MIDGIVGNARGKSPIIIAGNSNAWAVEWGSIRTNRRGRALLEAFAAADLDILNEGNAHTFSHNGRGSIIDITLPNSALSRTIQWRVAADVYTHSPHSALLYETLSPQ